jgi:hypothetical protein
MRTERPGAGFGERPFSSVGSSYQGSHSPSCAGCERARRGGLRGPLLSAALRSVRSVRPTWGGWAARGGRASARSARPTRAPAKRQGQGFRCLPCLGKRDADVCGTASGFRPLRRRWPVVTTQTQTRDGRLPSPAGCRPRPYDADHAMQTTPHTITRSEANKNPDSRSSQRTHNADTSHTWRANFPRSFCGPDLDVVGAEARVGGAGEGAGSKRPTLRPPLRVGPACVACVERSGAGGGDFGVGGDAQGLRETHLVAGNEGR